MDSRLDWNEFVRVLHNPTTLDRFTQFAVNDFSVEGLLFFRRLHKLRWKIRNHRGEITGRTSASVSANSFGQSSLHISESFGTPSNVHHGVEDAQLMDSDLYQEVSRIYLTFLQEASEYEINVTAGARSIAATELERYQMHQTDGYLTIEDLTIIFGPAENEVLRNIYEYTYPRFLIEEANQKKRVVEARQKIVLGKKGGRKRRSSSVDSPRLVARPAMGPVNKRLIDILSADSRRSEDISIRRRRYKQEQVDSATLSLLSETDVPEGHLAENEQDEMEVVHGVTASSRRATRSYSMHQLPQHAPEIPTEPLPNTQH